MVLAVAVHGAGRNGCTCHVHRDGKKVGGLWFGAFGAGRTRGSKSAGNPVVLPAFSILSDIFSHSWYPMVIPCYPMVIFSVEKTIYPSYPMLPHGLDGDPPWKSWGGFAARKIVWPQATVKEPRRKWGALVAGCSFIADRLMVPGMSCYW